MTAIVKIKDMCVLCGKDVFFHFAHGCTKEKIKFPTLSHPVVYGLDYAYTPLYVLDGFRWMDIPGYIQDEIITQLAECTNRNTAERTRKELDRIGSGYLVSPHKVCLPVYSTVGEAGSEIKPPEPVIINAREVLRQSLTQYIQLMENTLVLLRELMKQL